MEKNFHQNYVSLANHASVTNIVCLEIPSIVLIKTVKQKYFTSPSGNLKQTWRIIIIRLRGKQKNS